jgi:hypothetical protein
VAEEVVEALGLSARELLHEGHELSVAATHTRAHAPVVAGGIGLVLEHEVVAIGGEQVPVGATHGHQNVLAVLGGTAGLELGGGERERVGEAIEAVVDGGEEQLALAREQAEDVGLGDAYAARYAVDGGAMQAAARKLVDGGRDQRLATLRCGDTPSLVLTRAWGNLNRSTPASRTLTRAWGNANRSAFAGRTLTRAWGRLNRSTPASRTVMRTWAAAFAGTTPYTQIIARGRPISRHEDPNRTPACARALHIALSSVVYSSQSI